jgi:hypothetical protein
MLANKWRILLCLTFWLIGSWLLYHIGIGAFTPADLFALVDPIIVVSSTLKLIFAILAVYAVFLTTRIIDIRLGLKFKEDIWPRINENPTAVGLYRGLVWLGTCLLMGQLLS